MSLTRKEQTMRLIDADALIERMYHDAFETDTDMQKWDGGCWIRYKMFENAINEAPTIDAESVVRCKECMFSKVYQNDSSGVMGRFCEAFTQVRMVSDDDYCSYGEHTERSE